jgi:hypothetical protein
MMLRALSWRFVLEPHPGAFLFLLAISKKAAGFAAAFSFDDVGLLHHVTAASLHAWTRTQRAFRFAAGFEQDALMLADRYM